MAICNQEDTESSNGNDETNHGPKYLNSNKAESRKRPRSPEPESPGRTTTSSKPGHQHAPQRLKRTASSPTNAKATQEPPGAAPETSHTHDSIPDPNPPPPPPPAKADRPSNKRKKNHRNVIEQRYRQRLNAQFDRLLAVLPPADDAGTPSTHHHHHHRHHRHQYEHETPPRPQAGGSGSRPADHLANRSAFASTEQGAGTTQTGTASAPPHHSDRASGADGGGDGGAGGGSQAANNADGAGGGTTDAGRELLEEGVCEAAAAGRVSKAEVLRRAKAYIRALERENRRLVAERRELEVRWEEKKHRGVGVKGG